MYYHSLLVARKYVTSSEKVLNAGTNVSSYISSFHTFVVVLMVNTAQRARKCSMLMIVSDKYCRPGLEAEGYTWLLTRAFDFVPPYDTFMQMMPHVLTHHAPLLITHCSFAYHNVALLVSQCIFTEGHCFLIFCLSDFG